MTCRCPMCGSKKAGKTHRSLYIHYNVRCDEDGLEGMSKVEGRRLLRTRLRNEVLQIVKEYSNEV